MNRTPDGPLELELASLLGRFYSDRTDVSWQLFDDAVRPQLVEYAEGLLSRRHNPSRGFGPVVILGMKACAEQLAQDALFLIYEKSDTDASWKPEKGQVLGWARTILRNLWIDGIRQAGRCKVRSELSTQTADPEPGPEEAMADDEATEARRRLVEVTLAVLDDSDAGLLGDLHFSGLRQSEIAIRDDLTHVIVHRRKLGAERAFLARLISRLFAVLGPDERKFAEIYYDLSLGPRQRTRKLKLDMNLSEAEIERLDQEVRDKIWNLLEDV